MFRNFVLFTKKTKQRQIFSIILHIWKIKVYMYMYDRIECKVSHGSCGPSTKAPWFRFCYVWSCVSTISTITRHKSLSSSHWGHFHVFFDTIYGIQSFSNLCLKLLRSIKQCSFSHLCPKNVS